MYTHTHMYAHMHSQKSDLSQRKRLNVLNIRFDHLTSPLLLILSVPMGSPSCGGDVVGYVFDIKQPSLPTPFASVLVSVSVFMTLSAVFYSINSSNNYPLSHSVLPVLLVLSTIYLFKKENLF